MINAVHLLWIIPLSLIVGATFGFIVHSLLSVAHRSDDDEAIK